ncbi:hypothetical protein LJR235_002375 [Pararhizobium sp. LjRoot235]|uniref:hypothetical protein n=1 Tax=Pararhizobium sp. LjRoot235 TaxID=3342291 RepID=UPI003ECF0489
MKPDADRSELLGQVIEMLLSDREKALSTGNITAAITASKTVADLLALRIQRAPEDEGGDSPLEVEDLDPRQLGRAILAVLGEAALDDAPEPAPQTIQRAQHELTAQRFEEVDEVAALDLSDSPEPAVGERVLIGTVGCWVELTPDGRWRAMHADGSLHRYCKSRDEAERQAAALTW